MPGIFVGDREIKQLYVGGRTVSGVYKGDQQIWPTAQPIILPDIGDSFMQGFYAGIIDTTKENIIPADAYQNGQRYALVVSPKASEISGKLWRTTTADVPAAKTRWDGLTAQRALASATFPAFNACANLPVDLSDGGSEWYLPALDELEVIYRNLKPTTSLNATGTANARAFPGYSDVEGTNPSSHPTGVGYTSLNPSQTAALAFQSTGAQALNGLYLTATAADSQGCWWLLTSTISILGDPFPPGLRLPQSQVSDNYVNWPVSLRPVRRIPLAT